MGFQSGRVSFCRFLVEGSKAPQRPSQALLDQLAGQAFADTPIGAPQEVESGWTAGDHLLDQKFTFAKNVFDGVMLFALRIDTHRVPAEVRKAYQLIHEQALAAQNPSGFISKQQRRQAREEAAAQVHQDLAADKHRRSKHVPVLWDLPKGMIYCSASGAALIEHLSAKFRQTFDLSLRYLSAGTLAGELLHQGRSSRDWEELRPSVFTTPPSAPPAAKRGQSEAEKAGAGDESDRPHLDPGVPNVPWTAASFDLKDFLGNEFLLWLWHACEEREGMVEVASVSGGKKREIAVVIDKALDMDCAWGVGGKQTLRGAAPTLLPEAGQALRHGKWPRKAGLIVSDGDDQYELSFQGDRWQVGSALLPSVEEADSPRALLEQRLGHIQNLAGAFDALYRAFLDVRVSNRWATQRDQLRDWIKSRRLRS